AGEADRQAQTAARRQKGEGLGLNGVAAPALVLGRRDGDAHAITNGGQQHRIMATAAADDDLLRLLRTTRDAQRHGLRREGCQGRGSVSSDKLATGSSEKPKRSSDFGPVAAK